MILTTAIQCRDQSTRMEHKSIRPFYNEKSILQLIIERLRVVGIRNVFVLTTEKSPKTQEIADRCGVKVFVGNEKDVHDRFCCFAIRYQPEGIIRICADNPFVAMGLMYPVSTWGKSGLYDYVSFKDAMIRHEGLYCEYISEGALLDMKTKHLTDYDKTNVSSYIYNHPDEYRLQIIPLPNIMVETPIRLTVDTMDDFKIAQKIYRIVREKHWMNIYDYIFTHNRKLIEKMNINMEANKK